MPTPRSPFLFGISGTRPNSESVRLLKDTGAAGVLLLSRNLRSPAQTRKFLRDLSDRVGRPLLFALDHEGGWVLRSADLWTVFPGNAALGRSRKPRLVRETSRRMASELAALGIGLNLAPVADVSGTGYNPGIGIRSFGSDTKLVSKMSKEFICGHFDHTIASCVKHFPGKGEAEVDAHIDIPTITASRARFSRVHLPPFRAAIKAGVPCVMTTHAACPSLDPSGELATFSPAISDQLLRKSLGFEGVIISDDLCMGAVVRHQKVPAASVRALAAGHDLLIVAESPKLQRQSADAVASALDTGRLDPRKYKKSSQRLSRLIRRYAKPGSGRTCKPDKRLPAKIARDAVHILQIGNVPLPLKLSGKPRIDIYWPDLRELRTKFSFEGGPSGPLRFLRRHLSQWPARLKYNILPVRSDRCRSEADKGTGHPADISLFFCFDALRYPAQKRVLLKTQRTAKQLVVILLKNPWDKSLLRPSTSALTAYGFRNCQIKALLEALR